MPVSSESASCSSSSCSGIRPDNHTVLWGCSEFQISITLLTAPSQMHTYYDCKSFMVSCMFQCEIVGYHAHFRNSKHEMICRNDAFFFCWGGAQTCFMVAAVVTTLLWPLTLPFCPPGQTCMWRIHKNKKHIF